MSVGVRPTGTMAVEEPERIFRCLLAAAVVEMGNIRPQRHNPDVAQKRTEAGILRPPSEEVTLRRFAGYHAKLTGHDWTKVSRRHDLRPNRQICRA